MGNSFSDYLVFIVLVGCLISGTIVFVLIKIREHGAAKHADQLIQCGNVSVLFDRDENVTVIPYVKDKFGRGRAVGSPQMLKAAYSLSKLGKAVRDTMKLCQCGIPCTDEELMSKLNFRGWKEFSEGKRNISVHYQEGYGVVFNTTRRSVDGSYQFNYPGFEKVTPTNISDRELGEVLIGLLGRCRC